MNQYLDIDLAATIADKDLGDFMSKKTLGLYANNIVKYMKEEVKLMVEVSMKLITLINCRTTKKER